MKILFLFAAASALIAKDVPPLSNAHLETRAFSGDLASQLHGGPSPAWFGYQIKSVQRDENCCWSDSNRGCWLEGGAHQQSRTVNSSGPVHLEGSDSAAILFRVAGGQI